MHCDERDRLVKKEEAVRQERAALESQLSGAAHLLQAPFAQCTRLPNAPLI